MSILIQNVRSTRWVKLKISNYRQALAAPTTDQKQTELAGLACSDIVRTSLDEYDRLTPVTTLPHDSIARAVIRAFKPRVRVQVMTDLPAIHINANTPQRASGFVEYTQ